ncbi:MAG: GspE/PulE family protein [Myxococcota bacterium]|nr:GspE/PulE family protein [Myxococcota bacterium]
MEQERLEWVLDLLVEAKALHAGQKQDVLNRGREQARHILLDKRAELRKLLGKQRIAYTVSEIELVASFRFRHPESEELVDERFISQAVAKDLGIGYRELDPLQLDFKVVTETFGGPFAERHMVVPLEETPKKLTVAMAAPWDRGVLEQIAQYRNRGVEPVMAMKSSIMQVIAEFHGFRRSMQAAEAEHQTDLPDLGNLEQLYAVKGVNELDATDQPVVQAVWYVLNYAFEQRASDIHIEPKRNDSLVRLRIDGILHTVHRLPKVVHPAIVSRIKTLGRMDIAEKRRPQDGRFKTTFKDQEVELRLSTVPTAFGEKLVLRIFDPGVLLQNVEQLGFFPRERLIYERFVRSHSGLILVTGPTGSGKTTTLYSTLHHLSSPRQNICTIEDPIEMVHESFNQMAIQPRIGFDYAQALRTVLRQDPDVVMVGEIRDPDTAHHAVQAALTGHLVISTLHTNDAASAITRLLDLEVYPFLLSSVLLGVVAQRLVRRVCPHCSTDDWLSEEQALALRIPNLDGRKLKVKHGEGCVRCRGTGYKGRTGLFELMPVTPRIGRLISEKSDSQKIKREALNDGMLSLREYGIKKLGRGETTYEEVIAATDDHRLI